MPQTNLSAQLRPTVGPLALLLSSIGLKAIMAVTGLILVGFLVEHLLGNLLIFAGREAYNDYAAFLHSLGGLLWVARLVLLGAALGHIFAAAKLSTENLGARPQRYAVKVDAATNYAARTMIWSGPIVLLFLIFHLLHFTAGVPMGSYAHSSTDVYANVVNGFSVPVVAYFYAFANVCLGMHLFHGTWSMFQTLGLHHPSYNFHIRALAMTLTFFIAGGNVFLPLAVLSGAVAL